MKLILIRHGEIDSNVAKIYAGRSAEPLNDHGRQQAHSAAKQMQEMEEVASLFTSPLRRARETAAIIGQHISHTPMVLEAFNELRMGPWEGLSEAEVAQRYPAEFALWNKTPAELCLEGRETLKMLQARAVNGVAQALGTGADGTIAIVSHVAVIRVLILFASGRPLDDYKRVHVPNASPLALEWDIDACRSAAHG